MHSITILPMNTSAITSTLRKTVFLFLILFLSSCTAQPIPESTPTVGSPFVITLENNPYAPKPEDISLQIGGVVLTSLNLSEQVDSDPAQVNLNLLGSLLQACDELRIKVGYPDEEYRIFVDVYSLSNLSIKCENVFQQFEVTILLGVYSAGRYTVWVNNEYVGDFVSYQ